MVLKAGNLEFKTEQLFGMKIGTSSKMKVCPDFSSSDSQFGYCIIVIVLSI